MGVVMNRRCVLIWTTSLWAGTLAACSGRSAPSHLDLSFEALQQQVLQQFPRQYPVAGLLQMQLGAPALALLPQRNVLRAQLPLQLSGPVLKQAYTGQMDLEFGLRYEPADHSVRARQIQVHSLEIQGLAPAMAQMLATYGSRLAEQALGLWPLYTLKDPQRAVLDRLDIEPGAITVTAHGLELALVPRLRPSAAR